MFHITLCNANVYFLHIGETFIRTHSSVPISFTKKCWYFNTHSTSRFKSERFTIRRLDFLLLELENNSGNYYSSFN